jgi:hypothetical protein
MSLHRVLGMRIGVPDPESLAGFYGEVGLNDDGGGNFTGTHDGPVVQVEHYDFRRLLAVDVGADDEATVAAASRRLTDAGLGVTGGSDAVSVVDPASHVTFTVKVAPRAGTPEPVATPDENAPGHVVRRNLRAPGVFDTPRPPRRLGHLVIGTPDFAGTRDLLVNGLGFKISDQLDGIIAFLRCSTDHHNVAVVDSPVPMLQHYSWECDDVDHVGHAATGLLRTDPTRHAWGFGRHFVGSNYFWYLRDPAGSFIEFYSDMDVIDDEVAWAAAGGGTFAFEHIGNSWGPNMPAEFVAPDDLSHLQQAWSKRS